MWKNKTSEWKIRQVREKRQVFKKIRQLSKTIIQVCGIIRSVWKKRQVCEKIRSVWKRQVCETKKCVKK